MNIERVTETSYMLDSEEGRIDANMNNQIRLLLEPDKTNNYYKCAYNIYTSRVTCIIALFLFILFFLYEDIGVFYLATAYAIQGLLFYNIYSIINEIDDIAHTGKLFRMLLKYWIMLISVIILEIIITAITFSLVVDTYDSVSDSSLMEKCLTIALYCIVMCFHYFKTVK